MQSQKARPHPFVERRIGLEALLMIELLEPELQHRRDPLGGFGMRVRFTFVGEVGHDGKSPFPQ